MGKSQALLKFPIYQSREASTLSVGLNQAEVTISDGEKSSSFKIPNIWFNNDKNVILETDQRRLKICLEIIKPKYNLKHAKINFPISNKNIIYTFFLHISSFFLMI